MRWLGVLVFGIGLFLVFGLDKLTYRKSGSFVAELYGDSYEVKIPYTILDCPFEVQANINQAKKSAFEGTPAFWLFASEKSKIFMNSGIQYAKNDRIVKEKQSTLLFEKKLFKNECFGKGEIDIKVKMISVYHISPETFSVNIIKNAFIIPPAAETTGTLALWLGAALFVLGLRRRNRVDASAPPAPSKWGRGN